MNRIEIIDPKSELPTFEISYRGTTCVVPAISDPMEFVEMVDAYCFEDVPFVAAVRRSLEQFQYDRIYFPYERTT